MRLKKCAMFLRIDSSSPVSLILDGAVVIPSHIDSPSQPCLIRVLMSVDLRLQNKGDVKVVVGKTYEKLVLKNPKDVLLLVWFPPFTKFLPVFALDLVHCIAFDKSLRPRFYCYLIPIQKHVIKVLNSSNFHRQVSTTYCYDCEAVAKSFTKLAKHFKGLTSIVFAKVDPTNNDHPELQVRLLRSGEAT